MINAKPRGFLFNEVRIDTPERSAFDLSFENKLSCNFGDLIPTLVEEVMPGDTFELKSNTFARFAPMLAPLMHKVDIMQYTFFVPNRLIWSDWENFITPGDGKITMSQSQSYTAPIMPTIWFDKQNFGNYYKPGSLLDYMGCQSVLTNGIYDYGLADSQASSFSALPFRAYQLIYDEYFRDQNLKPSLGIRFDSGIMPANETLKLITLRKKCWEKDIFTSALPLPQRGPDVYLPLGDSAPLQYEPVTDGHNNSNYLRRVGPSTQTLTHNQNLVTFTTDSDPEHTYLSLPTGTLANLDVSKTHIVDLSQATSATINTLRMATRLQSFLEKSARVGGRYVESLLAHFGVTASDARIQRPEFLGATRIPVQVSAVTAESASQINVGGTQYINAQGTQTGQAMASGSDFVKYTSEEHGFIIQISCVVPRTAYCQGVRPYFLHSNYLDYAWPEFGHLGEEEVNLRTLYGKFDETFGYQSRYANYKYHPDEAHGEFTTNLDFWTMTRKFADKPLLNESFVTVDDETCLRPFAVLSKGTHHCYLDLWHDFKVLRALPLYGTPTL